MQHARKLMLVDPKFFEQLQADREYKQLQKPAEAVAKTVLSIEIGRILYDDSVPKDEKVKLYQTALRRFGNVRSEVPAESKVESNPLVQPPLTRERIKRPKHSRRPLFRGAEWVTY